MSWLDLKCLGCYLVYARNITSAGLPREQPTELEQSTRLPHEMPHDCHTKCHRLSTFIHTRCLLDILHDAPRVLCSDSEYQCSKLSFGGHFTWFATCQHETKMSILVFSMIYNVHHVYLQFTSCPSNVTILMLPMLIWSIYLLYIHSRCLASTH